MTRRYPLQRCTAPGPAKRLDPAPGRPCADTCVCEAARYRCQVLVLPLYCLLGPYRPTPYMPLAGDRFTQVQAQGRQRAHTRALGDGFTLFPGGLFRGMADE